jgi:hypothetical protein
MRDDKTSYINKYIQVIQINSIEERCCFNCSNLIEDETHVILHCPVYSDLRNNLFTEVLEVSTTVIKRH